MTRVRREHEIAQFDSGHPDLRPGVVTEACRSDTAAAVVRLHLGPLHVHEGELNDDATIETPASDRLRGRGVTAAQQTFNLAGEGSNPSGPNAELDRMNERLVAQR